MIFVYGIGDRNLIVLNYSFYIHRKTIRSHHMRFHTLHHLLHTSSTRIFVNIYITNLTYMLDPTYFTNTTGS